MHDYISKSNDELRETSKFDQEWLQAKDFKEIPGPSTFKLLSHYLPGGKLHNSNLIDFYKLLRDEYGDISLIKGIMGKPNVVFTYNPADIEKVYRTEGIWPIRVGLETFTYYRKKVRPDVFKNIGGLVSEQGKAWADIRNKVNPIMMKVQTVRENLPDIDDISQQFLQKIEQLRDPKTKNIKTNFHDEVKLWAFESICCIGLNKRMGFLNSSGSVDPDALKLSDAMSRFFQLSFEFDVQPSIWKYYETPKFKTLIQTYDEITEITTKYINEAIANFGKGAGPTGVLEKLCCIDKQIAVVMAIDMLMAGMDTTSSVFLSTLYMIAKHPEKQNTLRREVMGILPDKNTPLTNENTKNMPYLRACIKEALRITPITPANFRLTGCDVVLSNYRVPKGTGVSMGMMPLTNSDVYFPQSSEFMPERWLKSGEGACPHAKGTNPFVYLPFGFGPRTCIGKRIAEMEMETLMTRLIRNYKISWYGDDLKYTSNIILIPAGDMRFKFEPI
ncbi:probable cytochrome P450 12b2, mitochondrial isoform X2 [Episyrphus balteatus]|uniref:probable cytochrome P450 12b2, mitochondrial isoform X2 n=1 Tax=Episyrphus balteatus TaxID=286459 RepID=UPI002485A11C|nr:probable cytochrome P450 12b2, mitochondrial isoform X2 [Episyrphus balteatus]